MNPYYYGTPTIGNPVQISTANTNRDGTGTLGTIYTGTTNGTVIVSVNIHSPVTTTAGMIRFYIADGTHTYLFDEVPVTAITVSASVAGFQATWQPQIPLVLPNTWILKASTHNGEAFNLTPAVGNY
jgi:hypothetical protein